MLAHKFQDISVTQRSPSNHHHQTRRLHYQSSHDVLPKLIAKSYYFHFGQTNIKDYKETKIGSYNPNGC
ncbi:MAG TPA: hypothetical protein VJR94_01710 [Candidatus Nitrosocosmicus sp.]|nr:hypothetical protein [Candidatus Nitrosocosmicus sp.]